MESKSKLTKNEQEALSVFKQKLMETLGENFREARLFGSRAEGTAREDSDFDLLIIVEHMTPAVNEAVLDASTDVLLLYQYDFTTVVRSREEYEALKNPLSVFLQLVKRHGVSI